MGFFFIIKIVKFINILRLFLVEEYVNFLILVNFSCLLFLININIILKILMVKYSFLWFEIFKNVVKIFYIDDYGYVESFYCFYRVNTYEDNELVKCFMG